MIRRGKRYLIVPILVGLALVASPVAALATFGLNIVGPGPYAGAGITILDNAPGDLNSAVGAITVVAGVVVPAITGFSTGVFTALMNPSAFPFAVDITFTLLATTGGTVQVTASATDFTSPPDGTPALLTSAIGGTVVGGSVTAQQWANLDNIFFQGGAVFGVTPGLQGPFGPGAFSNTAFAPFVVVTPYSVTDRVTMTLGSGGLATGDLQSSLPEPSTLLLLGSGLIAVAALARNRRRP